MLYADETIVWRFALPRAGWWQKAQICQETGKEQEVQVLYDEGLANHIGPEPCGGLREEADEKSVGARVGGVLRRESC